jgi:uncharacterized protein Yka (UPF0111/DUF47 family)
MMKTRIVEHLGQTEVLLPSLVASALAANDRGKLCMSALQAAAQRARHPTDPPPDLDNECHAANVDPQPVRALIAGARIGSDDILTAPGLSALLASLIADVATMNDAVLAGNPPEGRRAATRLDALKAQLPAGGADQLPLSEVMQLTSVPQNEGEDSIHRLVMDLHKSLNRLAMSCAEEVIAGAHAHGLKPDDRPLLEAFMRGVDRTRALKFDHPGLDTTATRAGDRLVIQNDIGTTDAHVLVVTVEALAVTITYTDVHRARAQFFIALLDAFPVEWSGLAQKSAAALGEDSEFYLVTGRAAFTRSADCEALLEAVGAALVFLIDWNKARKVLRTLVGKKEAIRLLSWSARQGFGHRAFLELGGSDLVASAIRHAAPERIGFGEQLEAVLGRDAATDFLRTVLKVSAETLLQGQSVRLAKDAIEADLVRHLDRTDRRLLMVAVEQAGLAREIAVRIAENLADRAANRGRKGLALAEHAKRIEEKADRIAVDTRAAAQRLNVGPTIAELIDVLEDIIDELEQAAFIASLITADIDLATLRSLTDLCGSVVAGTEAAASGIDAASEVPEGRRADSEDALAATTRLTELEHACDLAERTVTALVLCGSWEARALVGVLELARALERASDRLASVGRLIRALVMAHLSA